MGAKHWAWAALVAWAAGCGGTEPAMGTDGGTDAAVAVCASSTDCDDGAFCDGAEACMPGAAGADARGCVSGAPPCAAPATCDEGADTCTTSCVDADGDGARAASCGGTDCDDTRAEVRPGAVEVCDAAALDEDCDPTTLGDADADGDGYLASRCCNGTACGADCDDVHGAIHPSAGEICNLFDDDCDLAVDEGVLVSFFRDCDGDHDGERGGVSTFACAMPTAPPLGCRVGEVLAGWSSYATDCDDHNAARGRAQPEVPGDLIDNNCDGRVDELFDVAGGIGSIGGVVSGTTLEVVGGSFERSGRSCGTTYCVRGGITP